MSFMRIITLLLSVCLSVLGLKGQTDTLHGRTLQDVLVKGYKPNSYLREAAQGATVVDLQLLENMPRILGNADPMHYAQLLPGVQTNSEYDAGLHIQGCDNQHNHVGIEGVTLYNVQHALGFFSIFNATHFQSMQLMKAPTAAHSGNRVGGVIDMLQSQQRDSVVSGSLSVGPMSSQGTIRIPLGQHQQLTLSARAAYLNLLYGQWLKYEDDELRYSFSDYNLTWQWWPDDKNRVWVDAYYGGDLMKNFNADYAYSVTMDWRNAMTALHWNHQTGSNLFKQTIYYTHYDNLFTLHEDNLNVEIPSRISDVGYRGELQTDNLSAGLRAIWHDVKPQAPDIQGFFEVASQSGDRQKAFESSLFADYTLPISRSVSLQPGLRASLYHNRRTYYGIDPSVRLNVDGGRMGRFWMQGDLRHQYLFRTGFSNIGLPTEFWFAANETYAPQYAYSLTASHEVFLFDKMLRVEASVYYKWLYHQVEYSGNIFDLLYQEYDLGNILLTGKGRNYGLNLLVEKRKGRLTGWISYSLGRAMRFFDDERHRQWYPANHERIHELNVVGTYKLNHRWSFGATGVLASGTPYTAPRQFYLINNNIITEFSEHNANRLRPYFRVDVSANYEFSHRGRQHSGINFSLYNVTMHNNDLYYRLKIYKERFANKPFRFVMPILPSVNYYYSF